MLKFRHYDENKSISELCDEASQMLIVKEDEYELWIDKTICKKSGKPFKSGKRTGIPKDIGINPNSNKLAFIMTDDGTFVDCHQCKLSSND